MTRALTLGLSVASVLATGPALAEPSIEISGNAFDRATIERAVAEFWKACSPLSDHLIDVSTVKVSTGSEYAKHRLEKGWKKYIHLAIPLPERPQSLPAFDDEVDLIAGHTLHYALGSGSSPGMFGSKRVSQKLCGMPIAIRGEDTFKSVPAFSFLRY